MRREIVEVPSAMPKRPVPYGGNFSYRGWSTMSKIDKRLAICWYAMMQRCYSQEHANYCKYGALGVFVSKAWHDVFRFILDVKQLPGFASKLEEPTKYQLDKDYYKADYYSKETCVWVSQLDNNTYTSVALVVLACNPFGKVSMYLSLNECARTLCVSSGTISRHLNNGTIRTTNSAVFGWSFKTYEGTTIYRYSLAH